MFYRFSKNEKYYYFIISLFLFIFPFLSSLFIFLWIMFSFQPRSFSFQLFRAYILLKILIITKIRHRQKIESLLQWLYNIYYYSRYIKNDNIYMFSIFIFQCSLLFASAIPANLCIFTPFRKKSFLL